MLTLARITSSLAATPAWEPDATLGCADKAGIAAEGSTVRPAH